MPNFKELFSTPKKAAVTLLCIGVILVTIGACIVVYAAGGPASSDAIGAENAQNFAFADAGVDPAAAKSINVRYERFQGTFVYKVEFIAGDTEYEYRINASDGAVVRKESKTVKGPEDTPPLPLSVTLEEARDIALTDAGVSREQATFTEVEQDEEGGVSVYKFKFYVGNVEYGYEINAQTGAIYSKSMVTYVGQGSGGATAPPAQTGAPQQSSSPASSSPPAQATNPPAASAPPQPSGVTPPTSPVNPISPPTGQPQQTVQDRITLDAAKSAALADAGADAASVQYTKAELELENGVWVYEIEFCTSTHEYEYEINAYTGAVCHKSAEVCPTGGHHGGGHHSDPHHSGSTCIGAAQARSVCLDHAGCHESQVVFTKVELDEDDGAAVYEVEFTKDGVKYEYKLDAVTGDILEYEWES